MTHCFGRRSYPIDNGFPFVTSTCFKMIVTCTENVNTFFMLNSHCNFPIGVWISYFFVC